MNYPKQVLEIHNEFQTASDKLLASAKEVLCEKSLIEKAERLKKAGFTNSSEVMRVEKTRVSMELAALIEHYNVRYPSNKFITEDQVSAICKKYRLECAPVTRYKGFVPETKLKQIEEFKFDKRDEQIPMIRITKAWNTRSGLLRTRDFEANAIHKRLGLDLIPANHEALYYSGGSLFSIKDGRDYCGGGYVDEFQIIGDSEMKICAPKKDFDLTGLKKIGALFMSITTVHVPDPVVLQPCKGGFLIIAAWGNEASDELVVNPKHN